MLVKEPKPAYKRYITAGLKTIFVVEALGIAVSYGIYYKLNTDRDFRLYMYKEYNWALDGYYSLGEKIGGLKTREHDYKVWSQEGKI